MNHFVTFKKSYGKTIENVLIFQGGGSLGGIWLWGIQGVCKRKYEDRNSFI